MAERTVAYLWQSRVGLGLLGTRKLSYDSKEKAALWTRGLRTEVSALNRAGIPVIVVHPVPVLPVNQEGCAVVRVITGRCRASRSRAEVDQELRPARTAEVAALHGLAGAWALDFE